MLLRRPAKRRRSRPSETASPEFLIIPVSAFDLWRRHVACMGDGLGVAIRHCPDAPTVQILKILREGAAKMEKDMGRFYGGSEKKRKPEAASPRSANRRPG